MRMAMNETLPNPLPVFHDRDCDLSIIRGKRVAVIGYGSQGRTHALNLRDSGDADIVVGLKAGSATRAKALADGFKVATAGEAASGAEALWNTAWTGADDPTATLRIIEGAMVESAGGTERAWFFSAEEPSEAGGVLSVPIEVK